ncbi:MAG: FAD-dependent oxidoreductase [Oligoflexia bacterium]|nr:FAD-dependent oxidoreductase [Oligoflexia bacterium]
MGVQLPAHEICVKVQRMAATEVLCTVTRFKMLTPTVYQLAFRTQPEASFEAGQFISVIVPGAGPKGRDLRRAYSIASEPERKEIELCIKLVEGGPGSNYLYKMREGDTFRGLMPYGDFTYEPRPGKHALFIATGTGIAPFRAMVLSKAYHQSPAVSAACLIGVRTEDELLYQEDFSHEHIKVKWVPTVSQPQGEWKNFRGRVTDYLRQMQDEFPWLDTEFYLCGNGAMITEVKALLAEKGVPKESIHQEKYY